LPGDAKYRLSEILSPVRQDDIVFSSHLGISGDRLLSKPGNEGDLVSHLIGRGGDPGKEKGNLTGKVVCMEGNRFKQNEGEGMGK
jgi:hypothetical protein